jgi:hypothetical protein
MAKQTFTTGQVLTAAQMTSLQQTAMGGGSTTAKTTSYVLVAADAGTVVQMNSASATTITVNTALFAAGDTVQIQNVGAGVCTVTAGTATVSTSATLALKQYDAGTLYFNTTSAAIFFAVDAADGMTNPLTTTGDTIYSSSGTTAARLGIGSTGQVLTVASGIPSWATPASGGSMTSIASGSLPTGAATVTLSSISASYTNLILVVSSFRTATSGDYLRMRFNGITTASYASANDLAGGGIVTTNTSIRVQGAISNSANTGQLNIFLLNYAVASNKFFYSMGLDNAVTATEASMSFFSGGTLATTAISSITLFSNSTNNFAAGTYILYGVN